MNIAIIAFGLLILVLGGLGVVRPPALVGIVERLTGSAAGLYVAFAFRVILGLLLLAAAAGTRFPVAIRVLGIVVLISAAAIPIIGRERLHRLTTWWARRPATVIRATSLFACAFGAFLVYSAA
jgi:hypothetical protein